MSESDFRLLVASNVVGLFRYVIRLHCRHEATKGLLVGLLSNSDPQITAKIMADLQVQAEKMAEDIFLKVGDSSPQAADLLGLQEFLRKLE